MLLMSSVAIVAGIALLVWGADRFVLGASGIARNLGISPLIIGLTIVGFGTSAPEMLVSATAAFDGNAGLGVGNALGSNIANVALVVGVTAILTPLLVQSSVIRREFPVLFGAMLIVLVLIWDGDLSRLDGTILISAMVVLILIMVKIAHKSRDKGIDPLESEFETEVPEVGEMPTSKFTMWFIVGLVVLLASSKMLVWGAVNIATAFGVSDLVIGLTIVAIGTSLPELAASVMGALKNEHDIAIGNIIGSNMFNLLAVLAMPGLIAPGVLAPEVFSRDFPVMFAVTVLLLLMAYGFRGPGKITRIEGGFLLSAYVGYMVWLYMAEMA